MVKNEKTEERKKVKRVFSLEWDEELGPLWMNKDNLISLLKTTMCIGEHIELTIEDITEEKIEDIAEEKKDAAGEEKDLTPPPSEVVQVGDAPAKDEEKRGPCRFKVGSKCHRFPPKVVTDGGVKQYLNPGATDDCWCGEFKGTSR